MNDREAKNRTKSRTPGASWNHGVKSSWLVQTRLSEVQVRSNGECPVTVVSVSVWLALGQVEQTVLNADITFKQEDRAVSRYLENTWPIVFSAWPFMTLQGVSLWTQPVVSVRPARGGERTRRASMAGPCLAAASSDTKYSSTTSSFVWDFKNSSPSS